MYMYVLLFKSAIFYTVTAALYFPLSTVSLFKKRNLLPVMLNLIVG